MPRIPVNGTDIYYELHGPADAPVLALVNGILMGTASWPYQVPVLSKHYRLLLHDCRGQWQSAHPEGPYTMELHADDLVALLDALHIERAHIGGISYGGEVAMTFALKYPDRVRSLVLSSTVSHSEPALRLIIEGWMRAARLYDSDLFFEVTATDNFSEAWIAANQPVLDAARRRYTTLDLDAVVRLCECFLAYDIRESLGQIAAPALVMVGEDDHLKHRGYAEVIADRIPGAELLIIPHAGHAVCWERPGEFNTAILGFLAQHDE
ncbi:MAG: alpha/beta hydrolase [Chloroflexi bacterium]|nr:alpha/beta hydrolase [Chloroflexota bacterium]MBU1747527.1 alpha/beta hydrolase [Chloroflexota bacterium]MBU1879308.1 alpha/beta hydrolase [Chloroflexota bacterium]